MHGKVVGLDCATGAGRPLQWRSKTTSDRTVSRIYVETDIILRLKQETDVPIRVGRRSILQGEPLAGVTESYKILNLNRIYSGRTLLPARTLVRVTGCDYFLLVFYSNNTASYVGLQLH